MMGILNSLLKRKKETAVMKDIDMPPPPPPPHLSPFSKKLKEAPKTAELPKLKELKQPLKKLGLLQLPKFEEEKKMFRKEEKSAITALLEKPIHMKKKALDKKEKELKEREDTYKRDLDYLETLRRVHDNELRERRTILKQIENEIKEKENELLGKEERLVLEKKQISGDKRKYAKLDELEKSLKKKEDEILKQEHLFDQRSSDFEKSILASRKENDERRNELAELEKTNAKKALILKQFQEQIAKSKGQLQALLNEQKERLRQLAGAWMEKEKKLDAVTQFMGVADFSAQVNKIEADIAHLDKKDSEIISTVGKITSERQTIDKKEFETNKKMAYMDKLQKKLEYDRLMLAKDKEQIKKNMEKVARIKELKADLPSLEDMHEKLSKKINEEQRKLDQIMLQSVVSKEMLKDKEKELDRREGAMEKEFIHLKNKEQRYAEEAEEIEEKEFNEFVDLTKQKLSPKGIKSAEYFERKPKKIEAEPGKFDALIKNCRDAVEAGQLIAAKQFYSQLRDQFYSMKLEDGERRILLNTVRELYNDINLAMLR
ncbi:MAG: hypothetical protein Q7J54_04630 [Candidatus Woesearchaeota archaeon]|nr:hypothetical protein [Candidatus Woesearchaeota archaeon]